MSWRRGHPDVLSNSVSLPSLWFVTYKKLDLRSFLVVGNNDPASSGEEEGNLCVSIKTPLSPAQYSLGSTCGSLCYFSLWFAESSRGRGREGLCREGRSQEEGWLPTSRGAHASQLSPWTSLFPSVEGDSRASAQGWAHTCESTSLLSACGS